MRRLSSTQISSFSILLLALIFYTQTSANSLTTADNGEFQWIVARLGLIHSPGFPLYTITGHLFIQLGHLFKIEPAVSLNYFASLTSALTLLVTYYTLHHLIKHQPQQSSLLPTSLISLFPILILATSTTFWAQATMANIRSLTGLFTSLALLFLFQLKQDSSEQGANERPLYLFILSLTLGLTHHLSLAFMALIMTAYVGLIQPRFFITPRRWGRPLTMIGLGLSPLLYLPWRDPTLRTAESFIEYALGLGFQGDFFYYRTAIQLLDRAGVMINVLTFQFPIWFLILALIGLIWLTRDNWRQAFLLGSCFLIHTVITATYRAPQTAEYMLPAYLPLTLAAGYGLHQLGQILLSRPIFTKKTTWRTVGGLLVICLVVSVTISHIAPRYRSFHWLAQNGDTAVVTRAWLEQAPPNSVILADWHWYTPLRYLQEVEQIRPDIDTIYVFPRTDDYAQDWVNEINFYLDQNRPVITTHYVEQPYATLPPPQSHGDAYLFPIDSSETHASGWQPSDIRFGDQLSIIAFDYTQESPESGETLHIDLAWQASEEIILSVKIFGPPWQPYAQQDLHLRPQPDGLTRTRFHLTPRLGAPLDTHTILVTASQPDGIPLVLADGNTAATLTTFQLEPSSWPPITRTPLYSNQIRALGGQGRHIIGYDWDNTISGQSRLFIHWRLEDGRYWTETHDSNDPNPTLYGRSFPNPGDTHYVPFASGIVWLGNTPRLETVPLIPNLTLRTDQQFAVNRPLQRDYAIATRLVGYESDLITWAWINPDPDNDIPALGALPTLKWIQGTEVAHPRRLTIEKSAVPNQTVGGFLRLYDVFTNRPLPILDERHTADGRPWVTFDESDIAED